MGVYSFIFRALRKITNIFKQYFYQILSKLILLGNGVKFSSNLVCSGLPIINISRTGYLKIGDNCKINSSTNSNPIGRNTPSMLIVRDGAQLIIGNNVGMSGSTIICHKEVNIGDNVKIGGNACIYDTDFHSLNSNERAITEEDKSKTKSKKVILENNVFIGAHSTILKGVTIGENSIVGACSLVSKDVPANEIWGGNPATFIRKL
jgi:acetyltransferase-like isoleucine patch superfamily enzyme